MNRRQLKNFVKRHLTAKKNEKKKHLSLPEIRIVTKALKSDWNGRISQVWSFETVTKCSVEYYFSYKIFQLSGLISNLQVVKKKSQTCFILKY